MKPILVHIHIFYPELWPELKKCMQNIITYPYELYVTMVQPNESIEQDVKTSFPQSKIEIVENRGYDIGPFVYVLNQVNLDKYSYIIKLHTKRDYTQPYMLNGKPMVRDIWRKLLLRPFIKLGNLKKALQLLSSEKVGMVGEGALILDEKRDMESKLLDFVKAATNKLGIGYKEYAFVAGTMFVAKAELFKCIQNKISLSNFSISTQNRNYNDFVYVCERLFGEIIVAQNYEVAALNNDAKHFEKLYYKSKQKKNLLFYKKVSKKGNATEKRYYFLGMRVLKKIKTPEVKKIYLFSLRIYRKKLKPKAAPVPVDDYRVKYGKWLEDLKLNKSLFIPITQTPYERKADDIKIFAYYLPQFHSIPVNDENYGKGFTEWTNVASCMPQYVGHYQPKIPYDVGFYNLKDVSVMKRQAELAKMYGVYGFCFYYYWFNGTKVLDMPLENFLHSDIDLPFHFCWANENWSKLWDGGDKEIILAQEKYLNAELFFKDILPYIKDKRYEKIDNKPLFMIYRPNLYSPEDMKEFTAKLNKLAIKEGFDGFYFTSSNFGMFNTPKEYGFDGVAEFPPHGLQDLKLIGHQDICPNASFNIISLADFISNKSYEKNDNNFITFKGVFPSWDNSPRKAFSKGYIVEISNDEFQSWLSGVLNWTKKNNPKNLQYVYINAWNEWAEGAVLEPTTRYGYQKLQTVKDCMDLMHGE